MKEAHSVQELLQCKHSEFKRLLYYWVHCMNMCIMNIYGIVSEKGGYAHVHACLMWKLG